MKKILQRMITSSLLGMLSSPSLAADAGLESQLTKALKIKANGPDRQARSGPVILAYQRAGILNKKPDQRADYVDFYLLHKAASFMGHKLVLLEEEYMDNYVGCCVSPGLGLVLQTSGETMPLQDFAEKNACTLTLHADVFDRLKTYGIKHKLAKADYALLSCRERDAQK